MTTGYSGTFAFNGSNLPLPPSEGNWGERDMIGMDGNGRPIYSSIREFTMKWGLISTADLQTLINAQLSVANTGSSVVDLPKWGANGYFFYSYSGTYVNEPRVGAYFAEYVTDVTLIISNVRTN